MIFQVSDFNKKKTVKKMLILHKLNEERRTNVSMHEDLKMEPVFFAKDSDKFSQMTNQ